MTPRYHRELPGGLACSAPHHLRAALLTLAPMLVLVTAQAAPARAEAKAETFAELAARPSIKAESLGPDDGAITLDAQLHESVWQRAEASAPMQQKEPFDDRPASEETRFKIAYSQSTLYIAVEVLDSQPEQLIAKQMSRDASMRGEDNVSFLLDTFHDGRNAYLFQTNANGVRADSLVTDEGRDVNEEWDGVWRVAARRTATGYVAEIAIPFSTIRYDPSKTVWGLQVGRQIKRLREFDTWAKLPRQFDFFRVSSSGTLTGLTGLKPSRQLDLKPYVTGTSTRGVDDDGFSLDDDTGDVGLDIKWGITRNLSLDLTYNTDFAEVEADEVQTNLTRFSLFFPEKREFFLENAGIFEFGQRQDRRGFGSPLLKVFFSRRIGLSDGTPVPIDWGTRLTGRVGPWSLGVIDVQTAADEEADASDTNFGVVRLKRNVGERSSVGVIFTQKDEDLEATNRVYGVDADWNPTDQLNLTAFAAQSQDEDLDGDDWALGAGVAYQGRDLELSFEAQEVSADFNPEMGFLLREDVRRYKPKIEWSPRIERRGIRELSFEAQSEYVSRVDGTLETHALELVPFGFRTMKGDGFELRLEREDERLFEDFEISDGIVIPAGRYEADFRPGFFLFTSDSRVVSVFTGYEDGGFFDGNRESVFSRISARLSKHFRLSTRYNYNHIDLPGGSFTANTVSQRIDVSFTPDMSLNSLIQWSSRSELLAVNVRYNWIYKPGSDLVSGL